MVKVPWLMRLTPDEFVTDRDQSATMDLATCNDVASPESGVVQTRGSQDLNTGPGVGWLVQPLGANFFFDLPIFYVKGAKYVS
jgi:hypothetical protein